MSPQEAAATTRLANFPVTFFSVIMGLLGLTLALHGAAPLLPWARPASDVMLGASLAALAILSALYLAKWLRHPAQARAEWHQPVKIAFFPAISISALLLATALAPRAPEIARPLWLAGVVAQGALTLAVVSSWIGARAFQHGHLTPAWFIPAVGNVVAPVAGASLGFAELSWLFFSAGLVFWLVLLTLVVNRLIFHDPLPARLFPTLVILIAPPAVAFLAWLQLAGGLDPFARILLNTAYVFAAIVALQAPKLVRLPFALSFWALSFPLAALTLASLRYGALAPSRAHQWIGLALLALLILTVAGLALRTVRAILRGEICQPE